MAHRLMPKPDPAGRLFPVETTPASNISPQSQSSSPKPIHEPRQPRDYWEMILCMLVIAATLFVGWRIAQIVWHRNEPPQRKTTSANPSPVNTATPTPSQKGQASISVKDHLPHPQSHLGKPASEQSPNDPVVIQAIVGIDGKVKDAKVLRGNPTLAATALRTVRQLSFNPYAPNGTAVEFQTEVIVSQPGIHKNPNDNLQISIPQHTETQQTSAH